MTKEFIKKLLLLYPEYSSIMGPYLRKDNRQHIVLNKTELPKNTKSKLRTLSYPKAIMEVHWGYLLNDLTRDHKDKNPLNNEISNLQILSRKDHTALDCKRRKIIEDNCVYCNKKIVLTRAQLDKRSSGPFCSKTCYGKYGADVQNKKIKKLPKKIYTIEYTTNKEIN